MKRLYSLAVSFGLLLPLVTPGQQAFAQSGGGNGSTAATSPSAIPDKTLVRHVQWALSRTNGLDPTHIYVNAQGGRVTLTGTAISEQQLELAGQTTRGVTGVTALSNRLTIRSAGRESD
ncbi:BON domain-containing protein [Paraburkholderia sp. B3]|uniref:BON domain-containing protein n=1 Tax=Paraburkholderia sp. B3 TaxID=3134791 RepID=UPI0039827560